MAKETAHTGKVFAEGCKDADVVQKYPECEDEYCAKKDVLDIL